MDSVFFDVDSIDGRRRTVTFVTAEAGDLKRLAGSDIFAMGSDVPIGKVEAVERKASLARTFVTVRIADAVAWAKAKSRTFRGAISKVYGGRFGSLNLVDRPDVPAEALQKASADPQRALEDAMVAAGWDGRIPVRKAAGDPQADLRVAITRARASLAASERLSKAAPFKPFDVDGFLEENAARLRLVKLDDGKWETAYLIERERNERFVANLRARHLIT